MPGFLAMIWEPNDAHATSVVRDMSAALELSRELCFRAIDEGASLFGFPHPQEGARLIPCGQNSAVYGTLFRRTLSLIASSPVKQFSESEEEAVAFSEGEFLLSEFWGTYVAMIRSPDGYRILTDPCSSLPCYYMSADNITYVFSHLERCPQRMRKRLQINRRFISTLLAYDKIQTGETGLEGVNELQAGHSLVLRRGIAEPALTWDPRTIARAAQLNSVSEATAALADVINYVVACRAKAAASIALSLSGGLDSAIVAAALRTTLPAVDVSAVHLVTGGGDPSEAGFARRIADALSIPLTEQSLDPAMPLPSPEDCPASARPSREFTGLEQQALIGRMTSVKGRSMFTGQGGDHLFQEVRTSLAFADSILLQGLNLDVLHQLQCAARLSRTSVWNVLKDALPALALQPDIERRFKTEIARRQILRSQPDPDAIQRTRLLPDWALDSDGLPPAKAAQVSSLAHMFQIRSSLYSAGAPTMIHPLISQPLIEFCLRTPVHILCAGGIPRGLARLATEGRVPDVVRLRRTKGDASRFYIEQLASNRNLLRDVMLEGELVQGGYVTPEDMRACLRTEALRIPTFGRTALVFYAIECWLKRWKSETHAV